MEHFKTIDFSTEFEKNYSSESNIEIGQIVIHEKYGEGLVREIQGNEITVEFSEDIGTKYLDIEWAPIKFQ